MNDTINVNWSKLLSRIVLYFVVALICVVILYPYFVMVCTALKSRAEIFAINGTIFPKEVLWSNFIDIWHKAPMGKYMINSIIIAGGSTAIAMICGIPAAYALARMKFKGQTAFLGFIIVSQMFAPVVLLIGIYKVMQILSMTESLIGLIFINAAFNQAFTIWLLRGTFMSIAPDMEQAIWRVRNIAAPQNARRLKLRTPCAVKADKCYNCASPDRICNGLMIMMKKMNDIDMEVLLINAELGY